MPETGRRGPYGRLIDAPRDKSGAVSWPRVVVTFRDAADEYAAIKAAAEREGISPALVLRQAFQAQEQQRGSTQNSTEWGLRWADGTLENVSARYEDEAEAETVARALAEPHRQPPGNPLTLVRREPGGEWEEVRDE